jgi:Ca2+-transporting ATPase
LWWRVHFAYEEESMSVSGDVFDRSTAYRTSAQAVISALGSDGMRGLTAEEAQKRLATYGPNELPQAPSVPLWRKLLGQFQDPLTILLLVAALISFVAWLLERDAFLPYDAIVILAIVILNGILSFAQEFRAEQAVAALKAMASPHAHVLRDGARQEILSSEVVPGDILLLEEGDSIAADARVIESVALRVAEAALTGESTPVSKDVGPIDEPVQINDQVNMLFSGTAVAAGRGRAVVVATGAETELGKIADSLQGAENEVTPLQRELDRVGRLLGVVVIAIAVIVGLTILLVDRVRDFSGLVEVLLLSVSLAVAAVPEGLTAITTIVLSLGMQRMAKRHVIVRKLSAVETLGSTTVICTDKTGTLTKNEMTVRSVVTPGGRVDITGTGYEPQGEVLFNGKPLEDPILLEEVRRTLGAATLVNNADLHEKDGVWTIHGDPTEGALVVAAHKLGLPESLLDARFARVAEVPFSSERKLMSTAHRDADQAGHTVVLSKGAPDVLLARCSHEWADGVERPLNAERRKAILATVEELASEALRTLGVAYHDLPHELPEDAFNEGLEQELVWLGVIGMIDPPRPEAQKAVAEAQRAGVRVIMITGDHPITAVAIANELGIGDGSAAVSGAELQEMDDAQLLETVRKSSVFARVAPEHKLRIVNALQASGAITAMTGDGVNDAPALKTSDIGVAMGITGTDVAKGAADMVLSNDNFASIVAAIEEGRAIFANIQKFLRYLLSSNIGEVLTMFLGVVFAGVIGLQPEEGSAVVAPLLAVQILWINLLTDSAPALAMGVDPSDPNMMRKPPRDARNPVIDGPMWFDIIFVGSIMGIGTLLMMDWALPGGLIEGNGTIRYAQTLAFCTLVFFQLFNVFNARSDDESAFHGLFSNMWIWAAVLFSALLQVLVVYVPFLQNAFSTTALSLSDWLICIGVGSTVLWLRELVKLFEWGRRKLVA